MIFLKRGFLLFIFLLNLNSAFAQDTIIYRSNELYAQPDTIPAKIIKVDGKDAVLFMHWKDYEFVNKTDMNERQRKIFLMKSRKKISMKEVIAIHYQNGAEKNIQLPNNEIISVPLAHPQLNNFTATLNCMQPITSYMHNDGTDIGENPFINITAGWERYLLHGTFGVKGNIICGLSHAAIGAGLDMFLYPKRQKTVNVGLGFGISYISIRNKDIIFRSTDWQAPSIMMIRNTSFLSLTPARCKINYIFSEKCNLGLDVGIGCNVTNGKYLAGSYRESNPFILQGGFVFGYRF